VQGNSLAQWKGEIRIGFARLRKLDMVLSWREVRQRGAGETVLGEDSDVIEGDLNNQYAKSAFPSYSRIDFADIFYFFLKLTE